MLTFPPTDRTLPGATVLTQAPADSADPTRPELVSRALLLRFVSVVGSSIGFYLPLSVVPLLAKESGSAGTAGLATVALLLTTVVCELVTPRLVSLVGYRWALGLGLSLLGAPTIVLTFADSTWVIIAVSVVRGAGFGISIVAGGAVTALLIPASRRGEGLALVGIVGGVPGLFALPAGVWAASRWGYDPVFVVTTVATLLALLSVPGLPGRGASVSAKEHHGVLGRRAQSALFAPGDDLRGVHRRGRRARHVPAAGHLRPAGLGGRGRAARPAGRVHRRSLVRRPHRRPDRTARSAGARTGVPWRGSRPSRPRVRRTQ